MNSINLESVPATLHRNLDWEAYFSCYSRERDGRAHVATYSFDAGAIKAFSRLMPFSTFYIDQKYEPAASKFVRRFPMFLVYSVKGLHSKCVFLEKSGRLLIGSQNLFAEKSAYEEVSCEVTLPEDRRLETLQLSFDYAASARVNPVYDESDVATYRSDSKVYKSVIGKAYLPCHKEVDYWSNFGEIDSAREKNHHYVYVVLEYLCDGESIYFAFDRHYQFCGELKVNAFEKLKAIFRLRKQDDVFLDKGGQLRASAPFKDQFARHHPVALRSKAKFAHYVEYDE